MVDLEPLQIVGVIIALVLVVLGPGGAMWVWQKKGINGLLKDLAAFKEDLAALRSDEQKLEEEQQGTHEIALRLFERMEKEEEETRLLRTTKHEHINELSALKSSGQAIEDRLKRIEERLDSMV